MQHNQRACVLTRKTDFNPNLGNLTAFDKDDFPWIPQRVFMVHGVPHETTRGCHAHIRTEMVMVAVGGPIMVKCKYDKINYETHWIKSPAEFLYIPNMVWAEQTYSGDASLIVFCNTPYNRDDYIEDFDDYLSRRNGNN